jgi:hypothetical protein
MRKFAGCTSGLLLLVLGLGPVPGAAGAGDSDLPNGPSGSLRLVLRAPTYRLIEAQDGQRIELDGFGYLQQPGRPMLPQRESLILLPPGARATGIEVEPLDSRAIPGTFRIVTTPWFPVLSPLPGAAEAAERRAADWKATRQSAYADESAYPTEIARIAGAGTLRKYSYVRVAFRPFAYHAASGRLILHSRVRVTVRYEIPSLGEAEARQAERLRNDGAADETAARLFVNFETLRDAYQSGDGKRSRRDDDPHHDYVIITTMGLSKSITFSGFVDWKSSLGFDVRIVHTTDPEIAGQAGSDLAQRIRNFLRAHYAAWGIEHVLLVGGIEDVPMRSCYPDPQNHVHDPSNPGVGPGDVPTDVYYSDLSFPDSESWDLDGDGYYGEYGQDLPDLLAEVNVGRIPISDPDRITYTLDKLVRVEQDTGAWKRQALHAGAILFFANQNGMEIPLRDGAVCLHEIESYGMQDWTVSRYSEQEGLVTSLFDWPALSQAAFLSDWDGGSYGFVNWAGHGWPDGVSRTVWTWDDGDGIPETDGSDGFWSPSMISDSVVLQDDFPSIVCAVSCDVGYPDPNAYGNLGINLLTHPARGAAAAVISATRYAHVSRDWPAEPGGAETTCSDLNRFLVAGPGGARLLGAALHESKFLAHVQHGWEDYPEYRNYFDYNLYGDPAMDWRGAGARTGNLLRNSETTSVDPPTPGVETLLPLDPAEDLHVADFVAGDSVVDPGPDCPLVFYAVDAPVRIWLSRTESGEIRIDF